jgi:hypothetical protein
MIRTGLTGFYVAEYSFADGAAAYSNGGIQFDAVSIQDDVQSADNTSSFYVNNVAKYHSGGGKITGSNLTVGTDGLNPAIAKFLLGVPTAAKNAQNFLAYGSELNPPYVGFGWIEYVEDDDHGSKYLPKVYTKVRFTPTGKTINTNGESKEFQPESLTGAAIPTDEVLTVDGDKVSPIWVEPTALCTTAAAAAAFIETFLNFSGTVG